MVALPTVVEAPGSRVFAVLYEMFEADEKELDNWDGVSPGCYRMAEVRVETLDGNVLAWLYVLTFDEGGQPSARRGRHPGRRRGSGRAPGDYAATLRALPRGKLGASNAGPEPLWT
jgi:gamma-glutamylcyclotransferase (GGCT)/AIG2-like uncharacterized protein YtfP